MSHELSDVCAVPALLLDFPQGLGCKSKLYGLV
jgi:hypothetical protein